MKQFKKKIIINRESSKDTRKIASLGKLGFCLFTKGTKGGRRVGVRRLGAFNFSLLGKWCRRMVVDKEGLWYRVLKARYGEEGAWEALFFMVEDVV